MYIYIALGANLGHREQAMRHAIKALDERLGTLVKCSSFYETRPVGFVSEHLFLNAAAIFDTSLSAEEALDVTQAIEREMGRTRKSHDGIHYDRCIDIDLLFLGEEYLQTPRLTLPHPHLTERDFVLRPLAEIAPDLRHPLTGLTIRRHLELLEQKEAAESTDAPHNT